MSLGRRRIFECLTVGFTIAQNSVIKSTKPWAYAIVFACQSVAAWFAIAWVGLGRRRIFECVTVGFAVAQYSAMKSTKPWAYAIVFCMPVRCGMVCNRVGGFGSSSHF